MQKRPIIKTRDIVTQRHVGIESHAFTDEREKEREREKGQEESETEK